MSRTGGKSANFRPSLTRAETIESCNSDDLVTVLEMHNRKPYKIFDRNRESKKGVMAESLEELISRGKAKLNYAVDKKVYVVLEEDGTEVDEEEYFQTLPANTLLMLLYVGDRWSPFGPPFTPPKGSRQPKSSSSAVVLASSSSYQDDEPDSKSLLSSRGCSFDLLTLLDRLKTDMGTIALFSGKELELLSEMEPSEISATDKYNLEFLRQIQEAADRHLREKREIRDALGLLKIYQKSTDVQNKASSTSSQSPSKRKRKDN